MLPKEELTRVSLDESNSTTRETMAQINVPPTRSNLIRIKQELKFAREGYEILDRKREVLTTELVRVAHEAEVLQQEVWKLLGEAYRALENAQSDAWDANSVEWAALAANKTVDVQLKFRGIMGVAIPVIEASRRAATRCSTVSADTNACAGRSQRHLPGSADPHPGAVHAGDDRLAAGRRTAQDPTAGECPAAHLHPEYEETVEFIVSSLEEREREETFRLKLLKTKLSKQEAKEDLEQENRRAEAEEAVVM